MPSTPDPTLNALLDSWDRSNTILLNLLRALPEGTLEARALEGSPAVAAQLSHIHSTRLFFLTHTAPEFAKDLTQLFREEGEVRIAERDPKRIAQALEQSAKAIGDAVQNRIEKAQPMKGESVSYDHPVLLLQHMLWHEGYHFGQIKLALKAAGHVLSEEDEEKLVWSLWRTEIW
jgi:uncharacterized damage-inducible protein DinB